MKSIKETIHISLLLSLTVGLITSCVGDKKPQEKRDIRLDKSELTLFVGEEASLKVQDIDERFTLNWSSDKPEIAKIENGKVMAIAPGTANISVLVHCPCDKELTLDCKVTVKAKEDSATTTITFDDANLKRMILKAYPNADTDKDGELSPKEAEGITKLLFGFEDKTDIKPEEKIASLKGLEHFINLDSLDLKNQFVADPVPLQALSKLTFLNLGNNDIAFIELKSMAKLADLRLYGNRKLTSIDLSNTLFLRDLYLQNTGITRLDLTPLKQLEKALINKAKLTEVTFSGLPLLERIDMVDNQLTNIRAINLPKLKELHANGNQIATLDLKELPVLQRLNLYSNKLTKIDFPELPELMFLFLFDNALTEVNLSRLPKLFQFFVSRNPLKQIDLAHNPIIRDLEAENMSALTYINLKNGGYNEEAEYLVVTGNSTLKKVTVDAGAEETHLKNLFKNNPGVEIEAL